MLLVSYAAAHLYFTILAIDIHVTTAKHKMAIAAQLSKHISTSLAQTYNLDLNKAHSILFCFINFKSLFKIISHILRRIDL